MRALFSALLLAAVAFASVEAQTPAPVILQAVTPGAAVPSTAAPAAPPAAVDARTALQLAREMQSTNAGIIEKQKAALETLDLLQKAAEEIKIFSKRG